MYLSSHFLSSTGFFFFSQSVGILFHLKFLLAWNLRLTQINQIFCETPQVVVFPLLPKRTVRRPISLPGCPCPLKISMWNAANLSWCCCSSHTQTAPPLRKACTTVVRIKDCRLIFFFPSSSSSQCIFMCCSCHRIQTCSYDTHTHWSSCLWSSVMKSLTWGWVDW